MSNARIDSPELPELAPRDRRDGAPSAGHGRRPRPPRPQCVPVALDLGHRDKANRPPGRTPRAAAPDAVEAQRRFLAYAGHELRSEITLQLTLAQATLADPNPDTAALRQMGEEVVAACWRQERLLEALLALARSEYAHLRREPVDLAATAGEVLRAHDHHRLTSTTALEPARTVGDPQLIEHLVANLVANAVRHNKPGGGLDIATYTAPSRVRGRVVSDWPCVSGRAAHSIPLLPCPR